MATDCIPQLSFKFDKRVVAKFDAEHASSDGGAVLLKALDRQLGVTETVAHCLRDRRQPGKVQHDVRELVRQRIFGLVCGYADCNDAARLADDAVHKLVLDRDPLTGPSLASQPTLSRFENAIGPLTLARLGHALADLVIAQHRVRRQGRARRITIDLDPRFAVDAPGIGRTITFLNARFLRRPAPEGPFEFLMRCKLRCRTPRRSGRRRAGPLQPAARRRSNHG
jgi:hypothetical protein